ncbi:prepilin peptidase [Laceyella putida]|uniref:Prepilin peptidase n=1 Tax=Laceyella putida TaxID=110101 RepID=A0ABW2RIP5_9BACL
MADEQALGVVLAGMGAYWLPEWAESLLRRRTTDRFVRAFYDEMRSSTERWFFAYSRLGGMALHASIAWWLIEQPFLFLEKLIMWIFLVMLHVIVLTDLMAWLIPNSVTYGGNLLFACYCWLDRPASFTRIGLAALLTYGIGYLVWRITGGIGMGDVKLLLMSVWLLGFDLLIALWLSSLSALLTVIGRSLVQGKWTGGSPFPYGPHLAGGITVTLFWGDAVSRWIGL